MKPRDLVAIALLALVCPLFASAAAPPDFDSLPLAPAGALTGRIVYVSPPGPACALREHDLGTGSDVLVRNRTCPSNATISPNGRFELDGHAGSRMTLTDRSGHAVGVGVVGVGHIPVDFMFRPSFSADSRRVLTCTWVNRRLRSLVSATATGKTLKKVNGTCNVAFTQRGLAVLQRGELRIAGKLVARFRGRGPFSLAANQAGTLLGVSAGPPVIFRPSTGVTVTLLRLNGRIVGRYHRRDVQIAFSLVQLSPKGSAAPVWWGCINQTAVFARGTFALRYGSSAPVGWPAFSPDGRYALLPRVDYGHIGEPSRQLDAVVADADTFQPLYRVPISASAAGWTP